MVYDRPVDLESKYFSNWLRKNQRQFNADFRVIQLRKLSCSKALVNKFNCDIKKCT